MAKIRLTKAQKTLLDAIDIEVNDRKESHNTKRHFDCSSFEWRCAISLQAKGLITVLSDRNKSGEFQISLTVEGIEYLKNLDEQGFIALNAKLARKAL